jgi:galactokinase
MKWNLEVVKELTFEEFKDKVDYFVKIGKLLKCSDAEIRKFYESTGKPLKN